MELTITTEEYETARILYRDWKYLIDNATRLTDEKRFNIAIKEITKKYYASSDKVRWYFHDMVFYDGTV